MNLAIKTSIIGFCIFFYAFDALAQAKEPAKVHLSGFSVKFGELQYQRSFAGSLKEFKDLMPGSELLNQDFDDFNQAFYRNAVDYQRAFSAELVFDWELKNDFFKMFHPQLRFGLSYAGLTLMEGNLNNITYHRIDTLISTKSGKAYYVDSVATDDYYLYYYSDVLMLDAAILFGSNPKSRWSVYTGLGLSAGITFNTYASVDYISNQYIDARAYYNQNAAHYDYQYKEEHSSDDGVGFSALASIPLGINFRISKDKPFWQDMNLLIELKPSISYINITDRGKDLSTAYYYSFGVKYKISDFD